MSPDSHQDVTLTEEGIAYPGVAGLLVVCRPVRSRWQVQVYQNDTLVTTDVLQLASAADRRRLVRAAEERGDIDSTDLDRLLLAASARSDADREAWEAWRAEMSADALAATLAAAEARAEQARRDAAEQAGELAAPLLANPALLFLVGEEIRSRGLAGERRNALLLYLALTSRATDDPISVAMKGPSAAGKSRQVAAVLEFFPEEAFLDLTAMTARALAYSDESLAHRCVVLYEAHGGEDASYFVRTLQSEGQIKLATVEKTPLGMQTRIITRPGPTNFVTTTTSPTLHDENETRQWSLTVDESPEQTRAVMRRTAERFGGHDPGPPPEIWLAVQRWLGDLAVTEAVVPFAAWLAERLPDTPLRIRRDFGRLLALIEVIALLYQQQRERDQAGRVIATAADYAMAATLLGDVVPQATGGLAPKTRHLVRTVTELHAAKSDPEATVSVAEVMMALGETKKQVTRWLGPALEAGAVVDVGPGGKGQAWRLRPGAEMREAPGLPDPTALALAFPHLVAPCVDPLTGETKTWPVVSRNTRLSVPVGTGPPGGVGHDAANWDSPACPTPIPVNLPSPPKTGWVGQWDGKSNPTLAVFGDTVRSTCVDCGELLPAHRSYRCLACTAVAG